MKTSIVLPVGLVVLLGIAGVYVLQTRREPTLTVPPTSSQGLLGGRETERDTPGQAKPSQRTSLTYFVVRETETDLSLSPRYVTVPTVGPMTVWRQAYKSLQALESFPEKDGNLVNPLPPGTHFLGVQIQDGLATVNLNTEFRENFNGGAREEQMTVYSIVNTLCEISDIKSVRFEIAGQPIDEFAGHLDLTDPLVPDASLVEPVR